MVYGHLIFVKNSGQDGTKAPVLKNRTVIGRSDVCDVKITREQVSQEHCELLIENNGEATVKNLSFINPVSINGRITFPGDTVNLGHGDLIKVGDRIIRWEYLPTSSIAQVNVIKSPKKLIAVVPPQRRNTVPNLPQMSPVLTNAVMKKNLKRASVGDVSIKPAAKKQSRKSEPFKPQDNAKGKLPRGRKPTVAKLVNSRRSLQPAKIVFSPNPKQTKRKSMAVLGRDRNTLVLSSESDTTSTVSSLFLSPLASSSTSSQSFHTPTAKSAKKNIVRTPIPKSGPVGVVKSSGKKKTPATKSLEKVMKTSSHRSSSKTPGLQTILESSPTVVRKTSISPKRNATPAKSAKKTPKSKTPRGGTPAKSRSPRKSTTPESVQLKLKTPKAEEKTPRNKSSPVARQSQKKKTPKSKSSPAARQSLKEKTPRSKSSPAARQSLNVKERTPRSKSSPAGRQSLKLKEKTPRSKSSSPVGRTPRAKSSSPASAKKTPRTPKSSPAKAGKSPVGNKRKLSPAVTSAERAAKRLKISEPKQDKNKRAALLVLGKAGKRIPLVQTNKTLITTKKIIKKAVRQNLKKPKVVAVKSKFQRVKKLDVPTLVVTSPSPPQSGKKNPTPADDVVRKSTSPRIGSPGRKSVKKQTTPPPARTASPANSTPKSNKKPPPEETTSSAVLVESVVKSPLSASKALSKSPKSDGKRQASQSPEKAVAKVLDFSSVDLAKKTPSPSKQNKVAASPSVKESPSPRQINLSSILPSMPVSTNIVRRRSSKRIIGKNHIGTPDYTELSPVVFGLTPRHVEQVSTKKRRSLSLTTPRNKQVGGIMKSATTSKKNRKSVSFCGNFTDETKTPDATMFDFDGVQTPNITQDVFVSPLEGSKKRGRPSKSPNVSSVKKLFKTSKPSPASAKVSVVKRLYVKEAKNDLSNVRSLRRLFSPYKSPNNDLTNVAGVKQLLLSPGKNSPKNNLTKIGGIRTLYSPQKSPKNDLTDVRGVKQLFTSTSRRSPKNDLTEVGGIRTLFSSERSPNNDLTHIKNIRSLFVTPGRGTGNSPRNDLANVSGVSELFVRHADTEFSPVDLTDYSAKRMKASQTPAKTSRLAATSPRHLRSGRKGRGKEVSVKPEVTPIPDQLEEQDGDSPTSYKQTRERIATPYVKASRGRRGTPKPASATKTKGGQIDTSPLDGRVAKVVLEQIDVTPPKRVQNEPAEKKTRAKKVEKIKAEAKTRQGRSATKDKTEKTKPSTKNKTAAADRSVSSPPHLPIVKTRRVRSTVKEDRSKSPIPKKMVKKAVQVKDKSPEAVKVPRKKATSPVSSPVAGPSRRGRQGKERSESSSSSASASSTTKTSRAASKPVQKKETKKPVRKATSSKSPVDKKPKAAAAKKVKAVKKATVTVKQTAKQSPKPSPLQLRRTRARK